ncbi:hypothetical protein T4E_2444 [Trichinella pseudospiralis]|uniref:Uncharacterized protein n=1 Tax=Trichinella pseudospiralis TaxID=6337 RepID=A0A0V0XHG7_TRIPS|nr:hypothetical protein T4E_2444 [Trichinella pseudospiralis]
MINVINREHITYCQHINYFNGIILKSKRIAKVFDPTKAYSWWDYLKGRQKIRNRMRLMNSGIEYEV